MSKKTTSLLIPTLFFAFTFVILSPMLIYVLVQQIVNDTLSTLELRKCLSAVFVNTFVG